MSAPLPFQAGTLRGLITARARKARSSGKLLPLQTRELMVEEAGARFTIRLTRNLERKETARTSAAPVNPFLPCDEDLCVGGVSETHVTRPYNLLMTRTWMMVAPRSQERFESISINALGFAGSFFVKQESELARLREAGPLRVLGEVAKRDQ